MNKETNPQNQFIVSYNENDFYCNSIAKTVFKNILDVEYTQNYCKEKQPFTINKQTKAKCNTSSTTTDEDLKCAVLNEICINKTKYDTLKEIQTTHSVSTSRFQDMNSFYNTEVLKSVNLGIGIAFLSFIIFREYKT